MQYYPIIIIFVVIIIIITTIPDYFVPHHNTVATDYFFSFLVLEVNFTTIRFQGGFVMISVEGTPQLSQIPRGGFTDFS